MKLRCIIGLHRQVKIIREDLGLIFTECPDCGHMKKARKLQEVTK